MSFSFTTSAREVLEQINRQPHFREITTIPVFAPQTIGLIVFVYTLFGLSTYAYLSGQLHWSLMMLINGFAIYAAFTPLHDATHRTVSSWRPLNDLLGTLSCFLLLPGITTRIYRYLHLEHHRFSGDKLKDPDEPFVSSHPGFLPFVIAFPDVLWSLWYVRHWKSRPTGERLEFLLCLSFYAGYHLFWLSSPYAMEFFLVWMIPQRIGASLVTWFFARIQHPEHVLWEQTPLQCTVQVLSNRFQSWLMLGQTVHVVHHFFPSVPYYRYHRAWKAGLHLFEKQNIPTRKFFSLSQDLMLPKNLEPFWIDVKVSSIEKVAQGVCTYTLRAEDEQELLSFEAGAHIDIKTGNNRVRQYSLCNSPSESSRYMIAVKEEVDGRGGSHYLHTSIAVDDTLQISAPRNNFPLQSLVANQYVLVAGGIGLTPLLSMAHVLHENNANFTLHIRASSMSTMPFGLQLQNLPFADKLRYYTSDTATPMDPCTSAGTWQPGKQLYICGPIGFMDWYVNDLVKVNWPNSAIFSENFVANEYDQSENERFKVKLARSGKILTVEADEFLLDVLNANNCGVICSCTQGICGSCITDVLEGVPEHRDAIMSDAERATNRKMCVCVGRSRSELLVLDL